MIDMPFVISIITAFSGVTTGLIGLFWGIHTYKKGQILKRQEILFPLIKEFDDKDTLLHLAREILDDYKPISQANWSKSDFEYQFPWDEIKGDYTPLKEFLRKELRVNWIKNEVFEIASDGNKSIRNGKHFVLLKMLRIDSEKLKVSMSIDDREIYYFITYLVNNKIILIWRYYHISNLQYILRDHTTLTIEDQGEISIRESFDALLDFFGKIGYLIKVGIMDKEETLYFLYDVKKIAENEFIMKYVKLYKFGLFVLLLEEIGLKVNKNIADIYPQIP